MVTGAGIGAYQYIFSLAGGSLDMTAGGMGWIAPGGGSWADATNWAAGNIPTNLGDVATFGDSIGTTNPAVITLDGNRTLSGMVFNTSFGGSYFITSTDGSTLTLANNGNPVPVNVGGGSHTLNVPITLVDDLSFSAFAGAVLTVSGPISESGGSKGVSVNGGGTLVLAVPNSYSGNTTVNGGVLQLNDPNAVQNSTVVVNAAGGVTFGTGIGTFNVAGLSGGAGFALADIGGGAVTLSVGGNNQNTTYGGSLTGVGNLTKVGNGTLTLGRHPELQRRHRDHSGHLAAFPRRRRDDARGQLQLRRPARAA